MPLSKMFVWMLALLLSMPPVAPAQGRRSASAAPRRDALAGVIEELLQSQLTVERWNGPAPNDEDTSSDQSGKDAAKKAPPDDAPLRDLLSFWEAFNYDESKDAPRPTELVRRRLLEACEDRPQHLFRVINLLPEGSETHDRLRKIYENEPDNRNNLKGMLHAWLMFNTRHFREELIAAAGETQRPMAYQGGELEALARLDWEAARPLLERAISPTRFYQSCVALSLLYEKALEEGDAARAEALRARMKGVVVDPGIDGNGRAHVLRSLMASEWEGQREWFLGLFANSAVTGLASPEEEASPSARGVRAHSLQRPPWGGMHGQGGEAGSLLASALQQAPEKWLPVVASLLDGGGERLRSAVARALVPTMMRDDLALEMRREAARKLLPWMTDPAWAPQGERSMYLAMLADLKLPESLAGAIWILEHEEDADLRVSAADIAGGLGDPRAAPALRQAFAREKRESARSAYSRALARCRGFSEEEMAAALEAYARMRAADGGAEKIDQSRWDDSAPPLPIRVSMGRALRDQDDFDLSESLAVRLIERARQLQPTQPAVARELFVIVQALPYPAVRADLVDRLGRGWVDLGGLEIVLAHRDKFCAGLDSELHALERLGGSAAGLAAVILQDDVRRRAVLRGEHARARVALLAASRFMRDRLPVDLVGPLLAATDRTLAGAAESYLEFEDSAEARRLIYARHPGEARILGERHDQFSESQVAPLAEEALRRELREQKGLDAVYAMIAAPGARNNGLIVRVRGGRAEASLHSTEGRRRVRWLTESELGELRSFTVRQEVEDLPAESRAIGTRARDEIGVSYEYLRITREGGRRILLSEMQAAPRRNPTLHEELSDLFHRLSRAGEYRTRYAIEEKIPGVEVLFADGDQYVEGICGEGAELRIRVREARKEGDEIHPLRRARQGGEAQWRVFNGAQPGSVVDPPRACRTIESLPVLQGANGPLVLMAPTRVGDAMVFTSIGPESAVWIARPGADPVRIAEGALNFPILTPDGQWLVGNRLGEPTTGSRLVRREMKTGREFSVEIADSPEAVPIAWLEAHGKILLGGRYSGGRGDYSLLDPATGAVTAARGEFRPLLDQANGRPLQPTGAPNEFWAALFDREKGATVLGRYDTKRFAFAPVLALPELPIHNAQLWVQGSNAWVVYQGDLLRVPLPAK